MSLKEYYCIGTRNKCHVTNTYKRRYELLKDLVIELELPTVSDAASYSISTELSSTIGEGAGVVW